MDPALVDPALEMEAEEEEEEEPECGMEEGEEERVLAWLEEEKGRREELRRQDAARHLEVLRVLTGPARRALLQAVLAAKGRPCHLVQACLLLRETNPSSYARCVPPPHHPWAHRRQLEHIGRDCCSCRGGCRRVDKLPGPLPFHTLNAAVYETTYRINRALRESLWQRQQLRCLYLSKFLKLHCPISSTLNRLRLLSVPEISPWAWDALPPSLSRLTVFSCSFGTTPKPNLRRLHLEDAVKKTQPFSDLVPNLRHFTCGPALPSLWDELPPIKYLRCSIPFRPPSTRRPLPSVTWFEANLARCHYGPNCFSFDSILPNLRTLSLTVQKLSDCYLLWDRLPSGLQLLQLTDHHSTDLKLTGTRPLHRLHSLRVRSIWVRGYMPIVQFPELARLAPNLHSLQIPNYRNISLPSGLKWLKTAAHIGGSGQYLGSCGGIPTPPPGLVHLDLSHPIRAEDLGWLLTQLPQLQELCVHFPPSSDPRKLGGMTLQNYFRGLKWPNGFRVLRFRQYSHGDWLSYLLVGLLPCLTTFPFKLQLEYYDTVLKRQFAEYLLQEVARIDPAVASRFRVQGFPVTQDELEDCLDGDSVYYARQVHFYPSLSRPPAVSAAGAAAAASSAAFP